MATVAATVARAANPMTLSLSCRVAETRNNAPSPMKYEDFLAMTKSAGFAAICLRASQAGIYTPLDRLYEVARLTREAGLQISMVTPDFPVPANTAAAADCLRHITPYLDVAAIMGAPMIRIGMKKEEDIPWARRASDEARERKIQLVHHNELNTLFATVEDSIKTLKAVSRRNFGYIHDECQLMVNTKGYRPEEMGERIKRLSPWLWNVYVKNQNKSQTGCVCAGGPEIPLADPNGVDFGRMFDALRAIGYDGFMTVHSQSTSMGTPPEAARATYEFLKPYAART